MRAEFLLMLGSISSWMGDFTVFLVFMELWRGLSKFTSTSQAVSVGQRL